MSDPDEEMIRNNVRRTVGMRALHGISQIVAHEQKADEEKARLLRLIVRYGWLALLAMALLILFAFGLI